MRPVVGCKTMDVDLEPPFVLIKPGVTEEEFYNLPGDTPWELLDGRLVLTAPARRHEELFRFMLVLMVLYLEERGGGVVLGSRFAMRLDPRWSPEPDLLYVRDENRHRLAERWLEGPGDLVMEIVSEGDPLFEKREKLPRYRDAQIPEIWLIDPIAKVVTIEICEPGGYRAARISSGRAVSTILPGFWVDTDWLWREEQPALTACLREILA